MKASNIFLIAVIAIVAISSALITSAFLPTSPVTISPESGKIIANVLIGVTRVSGEKLSYAVHNVIANVSKNYTVWCYTEGVNCTTGAYKYIAVGNGTAANNGASRVLTGEIPTADGCGEGRNVSTITVIDNSTMNANASMSYQWTAAATCLVNATALFNESTALAGVPLAIANFTGVTLNAGDKLNVTWWIAVV